jgi:hypothetical protein
MIKSEKLYDVELHVCSIYTLLAILGYVFRLYFLKCDVIFKNKGLRVELKLETRELNE